jgi:hypothetical protein
MSTTRIAEKVCTIALGHSDAAANEAACRIFQAWRLVFIHHAIR